MKRTFLYKNSIFNVFKVKKNKLFEISNNLKFFNVLNAELK